MNDMREYQKLAMKLGQGEITLEEHMEECEKVRVAYNEFKFRQMMLDNGLPEEQIDSITPEMKNVFMEWIEEMNELQKRVDNYANWAEDCPY